MTTLQTRSHLPVSGNTCSLFLISGYVLSDWPCPRWWPHAETLINNSFANIFTCEYINIVTIRGLFLHSGGGDKFSDTF